METLKLLLCGIKRATGIDAVPYLADTAKATPAITYSFYCTQDTGAVATYRLLVRVHAPTLAQALQLSDAVAEELTTVGDEPKAGLVVQGNGGGSLLDDETGEPQQITYFDITARS